jgi:hypothetical protein
MLILPHFLSRTIKSLLVMLTILVVVKVETDPPILWLQIMLSPGWIGRLRLQSARSLELLIPHSCIKSSQNQLLKRCLRLHHSCCWCTNGFTKISLPTEEKVLQGLNFKFMASFQTWIMKHWTSTMNGIFEEAGPCMQSIISSL